MPTLLPVWIAEYICATFASRIRFRIADVPSLISCAATRPEPSFVLHSVCEITACSDSDSIARTISFSSAGNTSMIRSMVLAALEVCSVPNTRWPVSAAVIARRIVSRSRISPTRMQSGSSRSAERSALENDSVIGPTSRWFSRHFLDSCRNSIGSSSVRLWPYSVSFRWLIIAARVVDLPEPVGPVTSTMPRGMSARSAKIFGALSCSRLRILEGIVRNTAPAPRFWLNALTRKRARPSISNEKSHSRNSSYALRWVSFMMSYTLACTCLWSLGSTLMRRTAPCTRIIGGRPAERCRSDALFLTLNASSWVISTGPSSLWSFRAAPLAQCLGQTIMTTIASNLHSVRERIARACAAAQRDVNEVTLLPVSKTFGPDAVREAHSAGESAFGENYIQEAVEKQALLADLPLAWHCIGPIQ